MMKISDIYTNRQLRVMGIGRCRDVANMDINKLEDKQVIYVAQTPVGNNYGGYQKGTVRAYIWLADEQSITVLFSNLKPRRATQALKHYQKYLAGEIPEWVWNNYITNGHHTRRGLFADYSSKEERIKRIAQSHINYLPTGNSKADHDNRVMLRN